MVYRANSKVDGCYAVGRTFESFCAEFMQGVHYANDDAVLGVILVEIADLNGK